MDISEAPGAPSPVHAFLGFLLCVGVSNESRIPLLVDCRRFFLLLTTFLLLLCVCVVTFNRSRCDL